MLKKRGLGISFVWIFAIIAGAVILLFFINLAREQITVSEKISAKETLSFIDSELDAIAISLVLDKEINLGRKADVSFYCDGFEIENSIRETEKIIASQRLSGTKINVWTQQWKYPFRIGNFYYLANKDVNFVSDNREFYEKLPDRFKNDGHNKIYVSFKKPTEQEIRSFTNIIYIGDKVTFYPEGKSADYFGDEMLYLAVFSANYTLYNCLKEKALDKLEVIASLYQEKASLLKARTDQRCGTFYTSIIETLEKLKKNPEESIKIKEQNEELQRNGCPKLY